MNIYDKFKTILHWVFGDGSGESDRAGVATFKGSPPVAWREIQMGVPSASTDGVDVEGFDEIDLKAVLAGPGLSVEVRAYVYDGVAWYADTESFSATAPTGRDQILFPKYKVGTYTRLAFEDVNGTVDSLLASPTNAEA